MPERTGGLASKALHRIEKPPSTVITVPVTKLDASDASKSKTPSRSRTWPNRRWGTELINAFPGGDLKKFSGDVLYVDYRSPVTRASDQIEDVKDIIEF